jgi:phosphoglycerate kinase
LKNISTLNIKNKRVLIRVDFNVPLDESGKIISNFRIRSAIPTIKYCLTQNASIVLMSHLGRPKGQIDQKFSLKPIVEELETLLNTEIFFSDDCISDKSVELSTDLFPGEIHLLENLRFYNEEVDNDNQFSKKLAEHGDVFINDAFGTAHRKHASNDGILDYFNVYGYGFLVDKELKYFDRKLSNPESPYTVILGGAKVVGKIELIESLMERADNFLIGGAMANPFLKILGKNTGAVSIDEENLNIAKLLLEKAKLNNVNIVLPVDVIASNELSDKADWSVMTLEELPSNYYGFDIGPESCAIFNEYLINSKTVFWNGPVGIAEIPQFSIGTQALASTLKTLTEEGVVTVIGGGDTASILMASGYDDSFSHISTGGGASIQLLSGHQLPAFSKLENQYL